MTSAELVFLISIIFVWYTFIGYPLLIFMLALSFTNKHRYAQKDPDIAILIVAHNEEEHIERKIQSCLALEYPSERRRIIVASDGSTDGTNECVASFASQGVELFAYPAQRGKASCLNDAMGKISEPYVVLTDARQRLGRLSVKRLLGHFADPNVGAVSGELVFETDGTSNFAESLDTYWRYEKFVRRQESRFRSTVGVTGALYALRRSCYVEIPENTILDDVVIPMNVVLAGKRVLFDETAFVYDTPSYSHHKEKARKIRTAAGNYQLLFRHWSFFSPVRNRILLQLISHKIFRLLAPFFLLSLLISNILIAPYTRYYQVALFGQALIYLPSLFAKFWPKLNDSRFIAIINSFLQLNWFAVLGLVEALRNRRTHIWR